MICSDCNTKMDIITEGYEEVKLEPYYKCPKCKLEIEEE